ncbi:hypothetical protein CALVIDRAFT_26933 [Calocera viscosa TUFC12733]|uniref:Uncharacterized protein n=1 Tax=Calocera viscosa (strain TUFC12733) TaxID=1330018 RepID=A0A167P960_CALVF|nr:hypothetical protein CALVIDRAFT_26933 [Calocera viscosa TUFC12733]
MVCMHCKSIAPPLSLPLFSTPGGRAGFRKRRRGATCCRSRIGPQIQTLTDHSVGGAVYAHHTYPSAGRDRLIVQPRFRINCAALLLYYSVCTVLTLELAWASAGVQGMPFLSAFVVHLSVVYDDQDLSGSVSPSPSGSQPRKLKGPILIPTQRVKGTPNSASLAPGHTVHAVCLAPR